MCHLYLIFSHLCDTIVLCSIPLPYNITLFVFLTQLVLSVHFPRNYAYSTRKQSLCLCSNSWWGISLFKCWLTCLQCQWSLLFLLHSFIFIHPLYSHICLCWVSNPSLGNHKELLGTDNLCLFSAIDVKITSYQCSSGKCIYRHPWLLNILLLWMDNVSVFWLRKRHEMTTPLSRMTHPITIFQVLLTVQVTIAT